MCVRPQTSQIGLNFASEEDAKRFRSSANDLLLKRGRKTGKYNNSTAELCLSFASLVSLCWKNHYHLVFFWRDSPFVYFYHSFCNTTCLVAPSYFFLPKLRLLQQFVCFCRIRLFDVCGTHRGLCVSVCFWLVFSLTTSPLCVSTDSATSAGTRRRLCI